MTGVSGTARGTVNGWSWQIYPFVKAAGVYRCPDDSDWYPGDANNSYGSMTDNWYDTHAWTQISNNDTGAGNSSLTYWADAPTNTIRTGVNLSQVAEPSLKGLLWDQEGNWHDQDTKVKHNWAFVDGHVKYARQSDVAPTLTTGINSPCH